MREKRFPVVVVIPSLNPDQRLEKTIDGLILGGGVKT